MPLTAFANEEARRNYIRSASDVEACRIIRIAHRGRNLDGNTTPILKGNGTPECHACTGEYPALRLTASTKWPHICCTCGEIAERRIAQVQRVGHSAEGFVSDVLATA